jgi:hypothetical protein
VLEVEEHWNRYAEQNDDDLDTHGNGLEHAAFRRSKSPRLLLQVHGIHARVLSKVAADEPSAEAGDTHIAKHNERIQVDGGGLKRRRRANDSTRRVGRNAKAADVRSIGTKHIDASRLGAGRELWNGDAPLSARGAGVCDPAIGVGEAIFVSVVLSAAAHRRELLRVGLAGNRKDCGERQGCLDEKTSRSYIDDIHLVL